MTTASSSLVQKEHESIGPDPAGLPFRSILAATDCSPRSAMALKLAARLAQQFHAKLYVLHSIVPELYAVDLRGPVPELALMDLQAARQNLHQYTERIPELRVVKHEETVFLGSVNDAIQSVAEAHEIDLLVLGSHGRRGAAKLALGSVAEWAMGRLDYPVLVAGPSCEKSLSPIRSIVLAVDLAQEVSRPLQYAVSIATDYNARLTVIHALPKAHTPEDQAEAGLIANNRLRQLVPIDRHYGCALNFEVTNGDAAPAILDSARANKANLIILGARHKPPLADHMPGTKLSAIVRGSYCPVLVVPAHSSDQQQNSGTGERK